MNLRRVALTHTYVPARMPFSRSSAVREKNYIPTGWFAARSIHTALLVVFLAAFAFGQSERGTITGVVQDSSGAVIPGARVSITNSRTNVNLEATTNQAGEYTVPSLQPGIYTVRVENAGFRPTEEKGRHRRCGDSRSGRT